MFDVMRRFFNDDSGASAVEYALFMGLIGVAVIGGAQLFTRRLDAQWDFIGVTFDNSLP